MHTIVSYLIKVLFCSALFYLAYTLLLSRTKYFKWNRIYLLAGATMSLLIPLISFPKPIGMGMVNQVNIFYLEELLLTPASNTRSIHLDNIFLITYSTISGILLCRILFKIVFLIRLKKKSILRRNTFYNVYVTDNKNTPFSFFDTIYWKKDLDVNSSIGKCILKHELAHVKLGHSWDKLFLEILASLFWINPFFWLFQKELEIQHEYAADNESIEGANELAKVILHTSFSGNYNFLINAFAQSSIKKRIIMISSTKNYRFGTYRKFIALLVIPVSFFFACNNAEVHADKLLKSEEAKIEEAKTTPNSAIENLSLDSEKIQVEKTVQFSEVAVKPSFEGGNANTFSKWVNSNITYPKDAIKKGISGTVIYQLEIDGEGNLKVINLVRSVDQQLDEEALRVLKMSPKWISGKDKDGNNVTVSYMFPIKFALD